MRTRGRVRAASPIGLRAVAAPAAAAAAAPSLGRSFAFLLASAVAQRGVPFLVNVAVARKLTAQEFGVPTVHFALVRGRCSSSRPRAETRPPTQVSTLVLTTREGFRRACLRREATEAGALHAAWFVVPAGAAVALAAAAGARLALGAQALRTPYGVAVLWHCLAGATAHAVRSAHGHNPS